MVAQALEECAEALACAEIAMGRVLGYPELSFRAHQALYLVWQRVRSTLASYNEKRAR